MKRLLILAVIATSAQAEIVPGYADCKYRAVTKNVGGQDIVAEQSNTCIEEPPVEVKKVKIGDLVRLEHVQAHPVIHQPFIYRGTTCRWFIEPGTQGRDLVAYQGIVCQVNPTVWRVIDKF